MGHQKKLLDSIHQLSFRNGIDPMLVLKDHRFIDCNEAAATRLGMSSPEQIIGIHPCDISPEFQPDGESSHDKVHRIITECEEKGNHRFLWVHKDIAGQLINLEVTLVKSVFEDSSAILCTWRSISKYRQVDESPIALLKHAAEERSSIFNTSLINNITQNYQLLSQHKRAIDASAIVSKTDPQGVITYVNDKFCETSGYSAEELIGRTHNIVQHEDMPASIYKDIWGTLLAGNIWQGIIKNKKKCGRHYYVDSTICPIVDSDGATSEYIALRHDITSIYEKDEIIHYQNTDTVSQLANSTKLESDIKNRFPCYLAVIHIAELKDIENAYPAEVYQQVIREVANILTNTFPNLYQIYRCFDNNFAVLTSNFTDFSTFKDNIICALADFEQGFVKAGDNEFLLSMFIGIANTPRADTLYNNAQLALALAIETNDKVTTYSPNNKIQRQLVEGIEWTKKLKGAIKNNGIKVFGQRIVDANQDTYSVEVLMRYYDPVQASYLSPALFLGYAEKAKLYDQLTVLMLHQSFSYFSGTDSRFSVNLTMRDIENTVTRNTLYQLVKQYKVGNQLTIELVESTSYDSSPKLFSDFVKKIRSLGCLVAIDDFGSGYSNFEFLGKSNIDIVKIDGSLISNICSNERHQIIVENIIKVSHAFGMKVVAEFIENEEIFEKMKQMNVDYFQGYYFDQPSLIEVTGSLETVN